MIATPPRVDLSYTLSAPILFRHDALGAADRIGFELPDLAGTELDGRTLIRYPRWGSSAFLGSYRKALERETKRSVNKDPSLMWGVSVDEDGCPLPRVQRMAEKIFEGTNERVLSRLLENLIDGTKALRTARNYIDGIQLDFMKGGGVDFRSNGRVEKREPVKASFGFIVSGKPRVEIKTRLPGGIKTRVEVPLGATGIRTTLSRKLTHRMRGTLGAGVEDSGEDRWVSMGLEFKF